MEAASRYTLYTLFTPFMLATEYLSCDFTFTFSFFLIYSKLNWYLFHLSGIFACKKMIDKVEISIWNIWMWRKCEAKFRNPLALKP